MAVRVMSELGKHSTAATKRLERRKVRRTTSPLQDIVKRAFDIAFAAIGLLLLSPIMLLISLGIAIESPGPILCRRKRYGLNNAAFEVLEFRTVHADQQETTFDRVATDRIPTQMHCTTRFGELLRRAGMDRIPHLVNVLRGEMSVVGPQPFTRALGKALPPSRLHKVRPGLVSWAQANDVQGVTAHTSESLNQRIECERYYLENRSFLFDMKILLLIILSQRTYL